MFGFNKKKKAVKRFDKWASNPKNRSQKTFARGIDSFNKKHKSSYIYN